MLDYYVTEKKIGFYTDECIPSNHRLPVVSITLTNQNLRNKILNEMHFEYTFCSVSYT